MSARASMGRSGLTPFRLSDIPMPVRRKAFTSLLRIAEDSADAWAAIQLARALDQPSDRVYWVPTAAWEREADKAMWSGRRRRK